MIQVKIISSFNTSFKNIASILATTKNISKKGIILNLVIYGIQEGTKLHLI